MASCAEQQWHNPEIFISDRMEVDLTQRRGSEKPGLMGVEVRDHLQRRDGGMKGVQVEDREDKGGVLRVPWEIRSLKKLKVS